MFKTSAGTTRPVRSDNSQVMTITIALQFAIVTFLTIGLKQLALFIDNALDIQPHQLMMVGLPEIVL